MPHPQTLIYLHGFNSSPQSRKATLCEAYLAAHHSDVKMLVPTLPIDPLSAVAEVAKIIEEQSLLSQVGLIGSSLGGYYALYLAERYGLKAVLVNPALMPYKLLVDYLGINVNQYTGMTYELQPRHIDDLLSLQTKAPSLPKNVFVVTQTGDEVLPYQEAITLLPLSPFWIQPGGDHAFVDFDCVLPAIVHFLLAPSRI